ncbi:MAG: HAD-IIA family hydrolase [Actinomycetales bacterium]|nr:HAD-IIA family hydrolase [Actinomycetales bacterium]
MGEPAGGHDVLLLDLDGVVYVGEDPVPWAVESITSALAQGIRVAYVTNNASRPPGQVAAHLRSLGVPATGEDVITSSMAGAALMADRVPGGRVLAVGGEGVASALRERGLTPVSSYDEHTAGVMQGYGPDVGWRELAEATYAVRAGLPWVATNLDRTLPTPRGPAPGNGSLVDLVAIVSGRRPDVVAGKPEPALLQEALRRTGAQRPLVIGDRLDTDIAAGHRLGLPTLLVLTGISSEADAIAAGPGWRPDYVAEDLRCLMPGRAWRTLAAEAG